MENQQLDPWGNAAPQIIDELDEKNDGFTDNFVVTKNDSDEKEQVEKLPDHEDYLNSLETKLDKLQKKSSISKELAARRSDQARRMLDSNAAAVELFEDEDLNEKSAISRRLFPEKQALTVSEIAQLLESDTLDKSAQEEHENDNDQQENLPS